MVSFAVLTPSRGLVHSRAVEAVMGNVDQAMAAGHEFRGWRLSHDLPIPDCDNAVTEAGLATGAEALWFVEEDTIPPAGALLALLAAPFDIAAIDYPVGGEAWACIRREPSGAVSWCGLGCTLIRRRVFEAMPRPWFETDWIYLFRGHELLEQPNPASNAETYGKQDIRFCLQAAAAGFTIGQVPGVAAQARLVALGRRESNVGWHAIELETAIRRVQP